tara:strand:+ start:293 stop:844 length:552 start_codon:yes stop_codon:yes gene_type:complete
MSISILRNKIKQYLFNYPEEKKIVAQVFEFLDNQIDCFSRSNLYGHFTGSAWVVDETNNWVLMTHHYQLNKWLQLGGHADGNENLLDVAINEAIEESGLNNFNILSNKIFDIDIHTIPKYNNIPSHFHFDVRFLLEAKKGAEEIIVTKESKDVAWIKYNEVLNLNSEHSIKRMLHKGKQLKKL